MSIDYLYHLLTPPSKPLESPYDAEWSSIEARLGAELPSDYKEFIHAYGSGQIDDFLWILNPFSSNDNLNLEKQIFLQRQVLEELINFGEVLPFKSFPNLNGLLPFGITDNGDLLFWKTGENSASWTVVINGARSTEWEVFTLSMSRFLEAVLNGTLDCNTFPRNFPGTSPLFKSAK
ncbi:hypothetical protein UNDYM_4459 [Undibacterium sp. YM2]|uniref:SMI1/KNR4 family protein n=1 Tax=Undibacterium sp. YM2 TaxID=2058625 RepID=UPI001331E9F6|nr:SMI1/KNR4 family protein [Undibacterium sp. YM2]BBB68712.1 hypothetical protein UNDYM_4459 [Undibacterium sp. YM2]